ncbi:TetR family transcriptional regulator [Actinocorallia herbida]|uniref:TetR family transcriptional regulator n=1 Tax=Actinocorallia herbida TaxID=58109 RepID=A0A3N1D178_9ACTN|nr:TetR/AcrR family transcriptional regulator [Actinocorallia herbida]ROO87274.1 TetR family transcriptional regulator [Actinocorallia herbida]
MTAPDARQELDLRGLLRQVEASGTRPHRFWLAPKPGQQERYERILVAAIEIAREKGYDAVQMRAVAARSEASLATVYTYFTSRDYLVFCAVVGWSSLARWRAGQEADQGGTPEERIMAVWARLAYVWLDEQRLLETWARSMMTRDTRVADAIRNTDWLYWAGDVSELDIAEELKDHLTLANELFFAGVVRWAFGQADLDTVLDRVLAFARRPLEAAAVRS